MFKLPLLLTTCSSLFTLLCLLSLSTYITTASPTLFGSVPIAKKTNSSAYFLRKYQTFDDQDDFLDSGSDSDSGSVDFYFEDSENQEKGEEGKVDNNDQEDELTNIFKDNFMIRHRSFGFDYGEKEGEEEKRRPSSNIFASDKNLGKSLSDEVSLEKDFSYVFFSSSEEEESEAEDLTIDNGNDDEPFVPIQVLEHKPTFSLQSSHQFHYTKLPQSLSFSSSSANFGYPTVKSFVATNVSPSPVMNPLFPIISDGSGDMINEDDNDADDDHIRNGKDEEEEEEDEEYNRKAKRSCCGRSTLQRHTFSVLPPPPPQSVATISPDSITDDAVYLHILEASSTASTRGKKRTFMSPSHDPLEVIY